MEKQPKNQVVPEHAREPEFTKEQLLKSKTLDLPKDAVAAILEEDKTYTRDQAENLVSLFLKGKV